MTGTRGPVPRRPEERRRTNEPDIPLTTVDIATLAKQEVEIPAADENWHPVARAWYDSLARSGQATFFEPSDWATAYVLAESLSRDLNPYPVVISKKGEDTEIEWVPMPMKGASVAAFLKGATSLLATEGDRRRVSVMLEGRKPGPEGGAKVLDIEQGRAGRLS